MYILKAVFTAILSRLRRYRKEGSHSAKYTLQEKETLLKPITIIPSPSIFFKFHDELERIFLLTRRGFTCWFSTRIDDYSTRGGNPCDKKLFLLISRRSRIFFWIGINSPPFVRFCRLIDVDIMLGFLFAHFCFRESFWFCSLDRFRSQEHDYNKRCRFDNDTEVSIAE